jgi:hypothetical protein
MLPPRLQGRPRLREQTVLTPAIGRARVSQRHYCPHCSARARSADATEARAAAGVNLAPSTASGAAHASRQSSIDRAPSAPAPRARGLRAIGTDRSVKRSTLTSWCPPHAAQDSPDETRPAAGLRSAARSGAPLPSADRLAPGAVPTRRDLLSPEWCTSDPPPQPPKPPFPTVHEPSGRRHAAGRMKFVMRGSGNGGGTVMRMRSLLQHVISASSATAASPCGLSPENAAAPGRYRWSGENSAVRKISKTSSASCCCDPSEGCRSRSSRTTAAGETAELLIPSLVSRARKLCRSSARRRASPALGMKCCSCDNPN